MHCLQAFLVCKNHLDKSKPPAEPVVKIRIIRKYKRAEHSYPYIKTLLSKVSARSFSSIFQYDIENHELYQRDLPFASNGICKHLKVRENVMRQGKTDTVVVRVASGGIDRQQNETLSSMNCGILSSLVCLPFSATAIPLLICRYSEKRICLCCNSFVFAAWRPSHDTFGQCSQRLTQRLWTAVSHNGWK